MSSTRPKAATERSSSSSSSDSIHGNGGGYTGVIETETDNVAPFQTQIRWPPQVRLTLVITIQELSWDTLFLAGNVSGREAAFHRFLSSAATSIKPFRL